jgi:translation initiation factor 2B subunit (eIF-2B alpha/beta/delta family)
MSARLSPESAIEDRIESEVEAYAANANDLADLCNSSHFLLIAILRHVLADCDGVELHFESIIRADAHAMERITKEAQQFVADEIERAKDDAAEYAADCARDAA